METKDKIFELRAKKSKIIFAIIVLIAVAALLCGIYLGDYYHTEMAAVEAFAVANPVELTKDDSNNIVFQPENAKSGLIFFPGGKVEYTAYIPLMKALASDGIACILVEMPFNLAVLDSDAAEGIQKQYPHIENWYIVGHSLGGVMAGSYISKCDEKYEGLILLGSYTTEDFSESDINVLSIYGSEDGVLNRQKYNENKSNLPDGFVEIVIDGGNHANFGMYGPQDGDGESKITNEEQISLTASNILQFIRG